VINEGLGDDIMVNKKVVEDVVEEEEVVKFEEDVVEIEKDVYIENKGELVEKQKK
jgi:hypothetical protein